MDQINNIELHDESIYPSDEVLRDVLGESYEAYCDLQKLYDENELVYEWRYYKDGKAWLCKVEKRKRTIVWMSAWRGFIKATIYFPEKYIEQFKGLKIDERLKKKLLDTKNVGKSLPCMIEIKDNRILKDFNKVMQFKIFAR